MRRLALLFALLAVLIGALIVQATTGSAIAAWAALVGLMLVLVVRFVL
jgi:hypothetical protein